MRGCELGARVVGVGAICEDGPFAEKIRPASLQVFAMVAELLIATVLAAEPALPRHLSGVWCYAKYASEEADDDVDVYVRGESIQGCANRGGFTIWPDGRGYTFGRFNVRRNSCAFEKVDLIESSGKGETYAVRVACDNSGEDAEPKNDGIEHIDLEIDHDGNDRLIIGYPRRRP
jgi:hypothetical protein